MASPSMAMQSTWRLIMRKSRQNWAMTQTQSRSFRRLLKCGRGFLRKKRPPIRLKFKAYTCRTGVRNVKAIATCVFQHFSVSLTPSAVWQLIFATANPEWIRLTCTWLTCSVTGSPGWGTNANEKDWIIDAALNNGHCHPNFVSFVPAWMFLICEHSGAQFEVWAARHIAPSQSIVMLCVVWSLVTICAKLIA